jgi:hypothetical protein
VTTFENAQIVFYDKFSPIDNTLWGGADHVNLTNGLLEYVTTADGGSFSRLRTFSEGSGILLDFKYSPEIAYFQLVFTSGNYGDSTYREFGLATESTTGIQTNAIVSGSAWLGSSPRWTYPNIWYRMAIGVGKAGPVMLIWRRDKPEAKPWIVSSPQGKGRTDFSGLDWTFHLGGAGTKQQVTIDLEDYYEIAFGAIK